MAPRNPHTAKQDAETWKRLYETARGDAAKLRDLCRNLATALEWSVEFDGECLGDNSDAMHDAKAALRKANAFLAPVA